MKRCVGEYDAEIWIVWSNFIGQIDAMVLSQEHDGALATRE